jgi:hypothetical protein
VALALIVTHQHRSNFELPTPRTGLLCQPVQERQALTIKAAEGQLLHSARNHASQEVLAETLRRRSSERHPPAAPKRIGSARPQPLDLSLDRGWVRHLPGHDHALGWAALLPSAIR